MEAEKEFGRLVCSEECRDLVRMSLLDDEEDEADIAAYLALEGSLD